MNGTGGLGRDVPEGGSGHGHVLPQCPHDAVRASSVSKDGRRACGGTLDRYRMAREGDSRITEDKTDDDADA